MIERETSRKTSISLNWKLSIEVNEIFGAPADDMCVWQSECVCHSICMRAS